MSGIVSTRSMSLDVARNILAALREPLWCQNDSGLDLIETCVLARRYPQNRARGLKHLEDLFRESRNGPDRPSEPFLPEGVAMAELAPVHFSLVFRTGRAMRVPACDDASAGG
jgi:hypothetical protein